MQKNYLKKSILSLLAITAFIFSSLSAQTANSDYSVQLTDEITIGTRKSFECAATIAHLAGFEEYNYENSDYSFYDEYFSKYLNDKRVKKAISHYKKLRMFGFSYDAVANISIYINPNCHTFRVNDKKILKENIQKRCGDPKKFLKILADFYDATDFETFYQSQLPVYQNAVDLFLQNKDNLITSVSEFEKYFKTEVEGIYISVSPVIGQNNFGTSFNDGKHFYYEPHYCAGYFDINLFIHELSHPQSKILVDEVVKNDEIMKLVSKYFTGEKKEIMIQQAYGTPEGYVNELINIANTMSILKNFTDESYVALHIFDCKTRRFDELKELTDLLDKYRLGDYKNQLEFLPEFEEGYLEILENMSDEIKPFEFSAEDTKSFSLLGKTYEAEYCGFQDLTGFQNFKMRKYWRIKNAYNDFCNNSTFGYLPYNNYPFEVKEGEVFRIEYLMEDGSGYVMYLRSDGTIYEDEPITSVFYAE